MKHKKRNFSVHAEWHNTTRKGKFVAWNQKCYCLTDLASTRLQRTRTKAMQNLIFISQSSKNQSDAINKYTKNGKHFQLNNRTLKNKNFFAPQSAALASGFANHDPDPGRDFGVTVPIPTSTGIGRRSRSRLGDWPDSKTRSRARRVGIRDRIGISRS